MKNMEIGKIIPNNTYLFKLYIADKQIFDLEKI